MSEVSLKHKIALSLIPRIGDINARKLVSHFGSVEAIFHEPYRNLVKIPGIGSGLPVISPKNHIWILLRKEAEYVIKIRLKHVFILIMTTLSD
jgi:DNA processing protein